MAWRQGDFCQAWVNGVLHQFTFYRMSTAWPDVAIVKYSDGSVTGIYLKDLMP